MTAAAGGRELSQRLAKIETAIFRRKTIVFDYYTIGRDKQESRKVNPYHLLFRGGQFYLIGFSHERGYVRVFRLSRIRGKVAYVTKAETALWGSPGERARGWLLGRGLTERTIRVARLGYQPEDCYDSPALWGLPDDGKQVWRPRGIVIPWQADGHVRDSVYFSIIDSDWPAVKAGLEKRLAS